MDLQNRQFEDVIASERFSERSSCRCEIVFATRHGESPNGRVLPRNTCAIASAGVTELLDLEHLRQFHREVKIACEFQLALHEGLHSVNFTSEDFDIIA